MGASSRQALHALSPLVYRLKGALFTCPPPGAAAVSGFSAFASPRDSGTGSGAGGPHLHLDYPGGGHNQAGGEGRGGGGAGGAARDLGDLPLWRLEWAVLEGRLLWGKGLHRVALDCLDGVIAAIKDCLSAPLSASSLFSAAAAGGRSGFAPPAPHTPSPRGLLQKARLKVFIIIITTLVVTAPHPLYPNPNPICPHFLYT